MGLRQLANDALARVLARAIPPRLMTSSRYFPLWEKRGYHVTPVHFYQPIPDSRKLDDRIWQRRSSLPGVELNKPQQLELLRHLIADHAVEFQAEEVPAGYGLQPQSCAYSGFGGIDGFLLYSLIRHFRPRRIVEIGAGHSTLIALQAIRANQKSGSDYDCELVSVDPYPPGFLSKAPEGSLKVIPEEVQRLPAAIFEDLKENDFLFIDSSHVVSMANDVSFLYLEVLPRIREGVIVHVHDIFLPMEYPKEIVKAYYQFWNEQYLLQAFLAFNQGFEVLLGANLMHQDHPRLLADGLAFYEDLHPAGSAHWPGSFWMRRIADGRQSALKPDPRRPGSS